MALSKHFDIFSHFFKINFKFLKFLNKMILSHRIFSYYFFIINYEFFFLDMFLFQNEFQIHFSKQFFFSILKRFWYFLHFLGILHLFRAWFFFSFNSVNIFQFIIFFKTFKAFWCFLLFSFCDFNFFLLFVLNKIFNFFSFFFNFGFFSRLFLEKRNFWNLNSEIF